MTWPIVCDDNGETVCSYCHIKTRHPCNSNNAKWCNNYASSLTQREFAKQAAQILPSSRA